MKRSLSGQEIVNLDLYPLEEAEHPKLRSVIDRIRAELNEYNCAVIQNFLSKEGRSSLYQEAFEHQEKAYFSPKTRCNVYLKEEDPKLPKDHPQNIMMERSNGS